METTDADQQSISSCLFDDLIEHDCMHLPSPSQNELAFLLLNWNDNQSPEWFPHDLHYAIRFYLHFHYILSKKNLVLLNRCMLVILSHRGNGRNQSNRNRIPHQPFWTGAGWLWQKLQQWLWGWTHGLRLWICNKKQRNWYWRWLPISSQTNFLQ